MVPNMEILLFERINNDLVLIAEPVESVCDEEVIWVPVILPLAA